MSWQSAERVQKNARGEYRALINGEWVPAEKAQKNSSGQFRVMVGGQKPIEYAPVDLGVPEWGRENPRLYGAAGAAREALGPLLEMGGMLGGSVVGTGAGGPVGGVAGAGLGYGMGKSLTKSADIFLGNRPGETLPEAALDTTGDVMEGAMYEMGGQALWPVLKGTANLAGKGIRTGRNIIDPWLPGGSERVVERTLRDAAGPDAKTIAQLLRENKQLPGGAAGVGEVAAPANRAEFSALQRFAEKSDPTPYLRMGQAENQARINALRSFGKDAESLKIAKQLRKQATQPLYKAVDESTALANPARTVNLIDRIITKNPARKQLVNPLKEIRETLFEEYALKERAIASQKDIDALFKKELFGPDHDALKSLRTIMERVKRGTIGADDALAEIKQLKPPGIKAQEAVQYAKDLMKAPDYALRENPQALQSASKNIGDMINMKGPTGSPVNEAIVRELSTIKKSIDHQIAKAVPEYGQAQKTFAEMSKPINQMQVGQFLENKLSPALADLGATGNQRAASFAQALRDAPRSLKQSTGFKRYEDLGRVLTPGQLSVTRDVGENLGRRALYEQLLLKGKERGAGLLGEQTPTLPQVGMFNPKYSVFRSLSNRLAGKIQGESLKIMEEIMRNPQKAAELLERMPLADQKIVSETLQAINQTTARTLGAALSSTGD